jgi:hypothetical protein
LRVARHPVAGPAFQTVERKRAKILKTKNLKTKNLKTKNLKTAQVKRVRPRRKLAC